MDVKCVKCGEPWDLWGLNHGDVIAWQADMIKQGRGCPVCLGAKKNELSLSDHFENETALEGAELIESNKSYGPKSDYIEICHCEECGDKYSIDINTIYYDGNRKYINGLSEKYYLDNSLDIEFFVKYESDWNKINGKLMCEHCFSQYTECDECGGLFHVDETFYLQNLNKTFCESCMEKVVGSCYKCEENYRNDELQEFEDQWLCENCLNEISANCEICGKRIANEEIIYGKNDENCCSEKCADETTDTNH